MRYNVSKCTAFQEFHDNPQLVFHQVTIVHFDDIGMVIVPHDHNLNQNCNFKSKIYLYHGKCNGFYLVEEKFTTLLFAQVHPLNSHLSSGAGLVHGDAHNTRRPFANLDKVFQFVTRITTRHHHLQSISELFMGQAGAIGTTISVP